ncbi:hypothetical protein GGF31_008462 [Allomyces arbusculus]|nr:hypothetical protein GGF31_008462 [Allomyces arbusculus]
MYSNPQSTTAAAALPPFPFSQRVNSNATSAMTHNPFFDGDDPTLAEMMAAVTAEGHGSATDTPMPAPPPPTTSWASSMDFTSHGGTIQGSIEPDFSEFGALFAADYSTAAPASSSVLAHALTLAPTAMSMAAVTAAFPPTSAINHGLFHVGSAPWGSSTTTTTTTTPRHDPLLTSVALPPPASSRRSSFLVPSPHAALDALPPGSWPSTVTTATTTTSGMPDMNPGAWADQYPLAPLALWEGRATSHVDVAPMPAVLATSTTTATAAVSDDSAWPTSAKMDDSRPLGPVLALETAMFNHHHRHHPSHDEPMLDASSAASTAHLAITSPTDLAPSALDELAAAMAAVSTPTTPGVTRQLSSLSLHSRPLASTVSSLSLDSMGAGTDAPLARIASGGGASSYGFLHDSGLNLGDTPTLAAIDPSMGMGTSAAQDRLHARRAAGAPEPLRLIDVRDTTRFQESPLPTPNMGLPDAMTGPLSPAAPDSGIMPSATALGMGVGNFALPLASQSPPPSSGLDSWWGLATASANAALAALAPPPPPAAMPVFGDGGLQPTLNDESVPPTVARPRALTVHGLPVPPMAGLFAPVQTQHPLELQRRRAASMLLPVSATLANSAGIANVASPMAPTFSSPFDVSSPTIPPTAAFHHTGVATVPLSPAWPLSPPPTGLPQAPTTPTPTTPGFPPGAGPSTPPSSGSQRVAGPRRRRRSSLAPFMAASAAAMDDWPSVPVSLPHVAEHSVVDPADIFAPPPPPPPIVSSPPTSSRAKVRPRSRCLSMPSASSAPMPPSLLAAGTTEQSLPAPQQPPAASPPAPAPTTPTATTLVFASGLRGGSKGKRARHADSSDAPATPAEAASAAAAPQATKRQRSKSLTALHVPPPALPRSCPACLLPEGTLMRSSRDLCAACIEKRQRAIDVANAAYQEQYAGVDAECASCHEVKPVLEGFHRLGKVARKICKVCDYRAQKERGMRRKAVMLEGAAASAAASAVAAMAAVAAAGEMDPVDGGMGDMVVSPRPTKSRKSGSGKKGASGRRRSSAAAALAAAATDAPSTVSSSLFSTSTATTDTSMAIDLPDSAAPPLFTLTPLQPPPPPPPMARRTSSGMTSVLLSTGHAPGTVPDEFLLASAADAALTAARAEDVGAGAAPTMFTTDPMHELHKYVLGGSTADSLLPEDLNAELQGVLATGDEMAGIWDASGAPRRASAEPRTGCGE